MKTRRMLVAVFAVLALTVGSAQAVYVELYSEDFEGGSNGTALDASPYLWTKLGEGLTVTNTTNVDPGGLAIDGTTMGPGDTNSLYNVDMGADLVDGKMYAVTMDAHVSSSDIAFQVGTSDGLGIYPNIILVNDEGGSDSGLGTTWVANFQSITADTLARTIVANDGIGEVIQIAMYFDNRGETDYVWASISDGTTTWETAHVACTYGAPDRPMNQRWFGCWDSQAAGTGELDNIVLAEVPEPVTLATLAIGAGLALLRRRK